LRRTRNGTTARRYGPLNEDGAGRREPDNVGRRDTGHVISRDLLCEFANDCDSLEWPQTDTRSSQIS
jgi:hypothetical protein